MNVETRRLYRSRDERMLAGVAGGLAKYFNIDPTIVRLLFVFFTLTYGTGFLVYLIMALVVPEEPLDAPEGVVEVEAEEVSEE